MKNVFGNHTSVVFIIAVIFKLLNVNAHIQIRYDRLLSIGLNLSK